MPLLRVHIGVGRHWGPVFGEVFLLGFTRNVPDYQPYAALCVRELVSLTPVAD
jgi:hypothetical protein